MAATLILLPLLAQVGLVVSGSAANVERDDVAYEELAQQRPAAAIARIEANHRLEKDNPLRLINLGAAYAQLGNKPKAEQYLREAVASGNRYDVMIADGSWLDSRYAARKALEGLSTGMTLAVR